MRTELNYTYMYSISSSYMHIHIRIFAAKVWIFTRAINILDWIGMHTVHRIFSGLLYLCGAYDVDMCRNFLYIFMRFSCMHGYWAEFLQNICVVYILKRTFIVLCTNFIFMMDLTIYKLMIYVMKLLLKSVSWIVKIFYKYLI